MTPALPSHYRAADGALLVFDIANECPPPHVQERQALTPPCPDALSKTWTSGWQSYVRIPIPVQLGCNIVFKALGLPLWPRPCHALSLCKGGSCIGQLLNFPLVGERREGPCGCRSAPRPTFRLKEQCRRREHKESASGLAGFSPFGREASQGRVEASQLRSGSFSGACLQFVRDSSEARRICKRQWTSLRGQGCFLLQTCCICLLVALSEVLPCLLRQETSAYWNKYEGGEKARVDSLTMQVSEYLSTQGLSCWSGADLPQTSARPAQDSAGLRGDKQDLRQASYRHRRSWAEIQPDLTCLAIRRCGIACHHGAARV